jgi:hypothetical protein
MCTEEDLLPLSALQHAFAGAYPDGELATQGGIDGGNGFVRQGHIDDRSFAIRRNQEFPIKISGYQIFPYSSIARHILRQGQPTGGLSAPILVTS